jgi:hypothetical protein
MLPRGARKSQPMTEPTAEFLRLQAESRYARERYQLYKARTFGPKPVDPARLAELERVSDRAEARLSRATDSAAEN